MGNSLFDYSDSDIAYSVSDNMAINSNGDYLMRMGDVWRWICRQESCI